MLTYPGDVTEALLAQSNSGHKWGPDICGARVLAPNDLGHAISTGMWDLVGRYAAAGALASGAYYDLVEAEYDPDADVTVARFRPMIDPRKRLRFHGGDAELEHAPTLTGRDDVVAR